MSRGASQLQHVIVCSRELKQQGRRKQRNTHTDQKLMICTYRTSKLLKHLRPARSATVPGARVVAQLVHVRVVLGHDGDGVALLADDETGLLLGGVAQVDAIILKEKEELVSVP